jgi:flagellar biosynthetic protein FliR
MGTDLHLDTGTLYSFLLVLARISGAFIYIPLPGIKAGPAPARALLAVSMTFVLFSSWPAIDASHVNIALLIGWILAEAGLGLAVGLAASFLMEGFQMGAQIISLQAGYSYATTVDPTSGADSPVLLTIAQMTAGLLFFAPAWIARSY